MMISHSDRSDVVIVGGGNAALSAAMAAAAGGAKTTVLEAAAANEAGGNSWFTDGAMRFAIESPAAIAELLQLSAAEMARINIPPYPAAQYLDDLRRAGGQDANLDLLKVLAEYSYNTMCWLRDNDIPLELIYDNQAHLIDNVYHFFGNLNVRVVERGIGMIRAETARCRVLGARLIYNARVRDLLFDNGKIIGVRADIDGIQREFYARAVVLACGGFEANADMRADYLGRHWRQVHVRGTRHNQGDGLKMALAAGAEKAGCWTGCHAVGIDFNAPSAGDTGKPGDIWKKHSYPYGLLLNKNGKRFVDEGANLRNYTYAKYGRAVLEQPGQIAYQIFDSQTEPLLRSEYRHQWTAKHSAESLEELAARLDLDRANFLAEIREYNAAVQAGQFNPAVLDGKCTIGLAINKSNWALPINQPPYWAFPIVCGITFTFGGLAVNKQSAVLDKGGTIIPGLFVAGEMVGGLFGNNYPGGSGLMSGAVFGRIAGNSAVNQN
ncbi:MAG: FAD-dependent tricarballylate dehydrogenase TcuA [Gammaproteobacteria bacterium]